MNGTDIRAGSCGYLLNQQTLRYILATIGLIIIVIFSKKIFLVVKVMFSSSKNEICS